MISTGMGLAGGIIFTGYFVGRLVHRFKLPSLIGYMLFGVVLGPSVLNILNDSLLTDLSFISDIALGFVAFSIGQELNLAALRRLGRCVVTIIFAESFMAFLAVFAAVYAFSGNIIYALLFGSMAPASAPAGTVAVIHENRAKGPLTKTLYAVVGFDDGLAILIFGFALAAAKAIFFSRVAGAHLAILPVLWQPLKEIVLSLLVGTVLAVLFLAAARRIKERRDLMILVFGVILIGAGLSQKLHLSLILTNMMVGFLMANARQEHLVRSVSDQIVQVIPVLFILFFCLAGAHLEIEVLPSLGWIGLIYIAARSAGLIGGAWLGAVLGKAQDNIRKYLGLGILSQAGVAIALALTVKQEFDAIGTEHARAMGASILTTVTATCIFFEIVGPILAKIALSRAGEIPAERTGGSAGS